MEQFSQVLTIAIVFLVLSSPLVIAVLLKIHQIKKNTAKEIARLQKMTVSDAVQDGIQRAKKEEERYLETKNIFTVLLPMGIYITLSKEPSLSKWLVIVIALGVGVLFRLLFEFTERRNRKN